VRSFAEGAADIWLRRGHACADESCEDALACYERAAELRPDDPEIVALVGRELLHLGRAEDSETRLRAAWDNGSSGTLAAPLARLYARELSRSSTGEAFLVEVEQNLLEAPDDDLLRCARAELRSWLDDFARAEVDFEAVLSRDPEHADARDGLAVACNRESFRLYSDGRTEQAIFYLKRAMALAPDWHGLHVNLGRMFSSLGKLARAEQEFELAAAKDPEDPFAWFNLGHLQTAQGEHEVAAESLRRARELDPQLEGLKPALAGALHEIGQIEEAIELLEEELAHDPDCAICRHNLGLAYLELGEPRRALEALRAAVDSDPTYFRAHYNLAVVLAQLARHDESLVPLTEALRLDEERTREWLRLDRPDFADVRGDPRFQPFFDE